MSSLWPVFAIVVFIWVMTRHRRSDCRGRRLRRWTPDPHADAREDEIVRLKERVRALEEIITGDDWRLRRDFDGL